MLHKAENSEHLGQIRGSQVGESSAILRGVRAIGMTLDSRER